VTGQEAARRWAALQLRPEAALLVGRFAVETSELLRVELLRWLTTSIDGHLKAHPKFLLVELELINDEFVDDYLHISKQRAYTNTTPFV
jgi:hypothetical protein